MKTKLLFTLISFIVFISCNNDSRNNFKGKDYNYGVNEWYFTNPKDSVSIYIQEYGVGKDTIVALHGGFGAEHRYIEDLFKEYYDSYHFIFYDQRGSLRSPCPIEKISIKNHISDLEAIRNELGIKKLNLFGHSNGSTLATLYLKEHPDKVKGFVMTACMQMERPLNEDLRQIESEQYENFGDYINRKEVQLEIDKIVLDTTIPEAKKKALIAKINHAKHYIFDISLWQKGMETYGGMFSIEAGNKTTESMQKIFENGYNNVEVYKNHPYPITIIMGEMDMIDPYGKKFEYWTEKLRNVYYTKLEEAAHDAWIDKPLEFRKAFDEAMDRYN